MLGRFTKTFQVLISAKLLLLVSTIILFGSCEAVSQTLTNETPVSNESKKQDKSYKYIVGSVEKERKKLAFEYKKERNKGAVLDKARNLFVEMTVNNIIPPWYGTKWDFYGTSQTPKKGEIACGYFVSTILRDAKVRVQRVSLAQQASENIIKSLTTKKFIKRFSNFKLEKFVSAIDKQGKGLYVVGLDFHVGFLYHDDNDVWFLHSTYAEPKEVIKERALESAVLNASKYRVTGKISDDNRFILKWLNQTPFRTIKR